MVKPLNGKKILITRSEDQAIPFSKLLEQTGATPLVAPLLTFNPIHTSESKRMLNELHDFSWVFFTSANGVKFFFELLEKWNINPSILNTMKIAVVGKKTNEQLEVYGHKANFEPSQFTGSTMVEEFLNKYSTHERILLVCGRKSRPEIPKELENKQVFFRKMIIYDTLINKDAKAILTSYIQKESPDIYTFTSPSSVNAFFQLTESYSEQIETIKKEALCVCIGTTTKEKAIDEGFKRVLMPDTYTIEGMVDVILEHYS